MKAINLKILAGRVAGIAMAAVLGALEKSGVPHDERGCLALAGVVLVAVVAKAPDLFAAAGILRPLSPGQASLYQKAVGWTTALIATPAAKRHRKAEEDAARAVRWALANPQTLELLRSQLWQPGQPVPAGAQAATPTGDATAAGTAVGPESAIEETGGNQ